MLVASVTSAVTNAIGDYGLYAVFALMLVDAVFPAASEVVMVYAGAIASGAISGQTVTLFGHTFPSGWPAYLAMALAGTVGYLVGAELGWGIGRIGGDPFLRRFGRWFHLDEERMARADRWFERRGDWAVLLGRMTPVVRSFISIPAGVLRARFVRYTVLTAIGSAVWCFVFAGVGWAAGASWEQFHRSFRYADYVVLLLVLAGIAVIGWNVVRHRRANSRASRGYTDSSK